MARMHSRDKGKSKSDRPDKKIPSWAPYKDKEVEKLVIKYGKSELSPSEIGLTLRDTYGINSIKALTNKKVTQILKENNLIKELPEDLLNLIRKLVDVQTHLGKNKHDMTAKRGLQLTTSKVMRLIKYYKRTNKLPAEWKFDIKRLKMYLE
jgi:small subunit ribosomal protein S15